MEECGDGGGREENCGGEMGVNSGEEWMRWSDGRWKRWSALKRSRLSHHISSFPKANKGGHTRSHETTKGGAHNSYGSLVGCEQRVNTGRENGK